MKEFISAEGSKKIWLRLGVVLWTSFKDDFVLASYADQYPLEIVRAKVHLYDVCDSKPSLSGNRVRAGDMVHLLHISPSTNYGSPLPNTSIEPDIYVVWNELEVTLKEYQIRSDNWELLDDGIKVKRFLQADGTEDSPPYYTFFDIHQNVLSEVVYIPYLEHGVGRYEKAFGFRWVLPLVGEPIIFSPVKLVPSTGSVYLSSSGWWWRSGTYNGITEREESYYIDYYRELRTGRGFGDGKGQCFFPSVEPSISLSAEVAFATTKLLNDRVSLFTFPLSNYVDNEVLVIPMPWRVGNASLEGKINPYPEFYMYPVAEQDPALSFGCIDAASYEAVDKEAPMEGQALKVELKKITGRVTMYDNGPTESIIHKAFTSSVFTTTYDNSYIVSRKVTETGEVPDVIRTEWSYLNTERDSSYDSINRTRYALVQKFLVLTDGKNVIEKIPYLYHGPDGFYLEIHYTWNGRTSATSIFTYNSFHCTEEHHWFRYFDITTGMMVADVRVTDTIAGSVKWERRIYTPESIGYPNTQYITVFTFTDNENNPITGLPDIRNIPPWLGEDADNVTLGEFTSLMYDWRDPFVANLYARYPASDGYNGITNPYFYIAATYFPAISEEFIFSVILLEHYKTTGSAEVRQELSDESTQQNVILPTDYGWATCMTSNWYIEPGEMEYHYNSSILVKSGGIVIGQGTSATSSTEVYTELSPQSEYDYIPDPPP